MSAERDPAPLNLRYISKFAAAPAGGSIVSPANRSMVRRGATDGAPGGLPALLAPGPGKHSVKLAQSIGFFVLRFPFRGGRRDLIVVKPQKRQRLVPLPQVECILKECSVARPIFEPRIRLSVLGP